MAKYLVTGGAGFIGSHLVEKLLSEGNSVVVLDNFSSGTEDNLFFTSQYSSSVGETSLKGGVLGTQYYLLRDDIRNYEACLKACEGVDYVLHQAALRSVPKSMNDPYEYNSVNIDGTLNMLRAAKEHKVKRFVFASSSSVFGDTDTFPEKESLYPLLISPYALTKLAGEYYCRIFSEHYKLETVCLRYFNVFGSKQSLDDEYAVVIPKFIHCMLNDKQPPIFGNGKQSRDFTYIDNVVRANILSATVPGIKHEVLNIANGKDNTILELVALLNKILGKDIKPEFLPVRAGDVFRTLADITKAKKTIGYSPKIGFEEGLKKAVDWFKNKWKNQPI